MTGGPSTNFHGVGIGPLSKILAVKVEPDLIFFSPICTYTYCTLISELPFFILLLNFPIQLPDNLSFMWFLHGLKSNPTKNFKSNVISLHSNSHSWETLHSLQSFEKLGRSNFHGQLFSDKKPRSRDDNLSLNTMGLMSLCHIEM